MVKPRQEFIGPITKLAAIDVDGNWIPDGIGIVDGYEAEIKNCTIVLNALTTHPTTGSQRGSFWVNANYDPPLPYYTDSDGNDIELGVGGGTLPSPVLNTILWSDGNSIYWSSDPVIGAAGISPKLLFGAQAIDPLITQQDMLSSGIAKDLTISAQNNPNSSSSGGNLRLRSGTGTDNDGQIYLYPGKSSVTLQTSSFLFDDGYVEPLISQKATANQVTPLKIQAQSSVTASATGADLYLMSGNGGSGGLPGSVFIKNNTGNNTQFSYDSGGYKVSHFGRMELKEEPSFNPNWSDDSGTIQCVNDRLVATSKSGYGTYTVAPRTYDQITFRIPRMDKQFGTFQLTGPSEPKSLNFSTAIHGFAMPASSILTGKFMIGWMGNGSYSAGGAMQFLFTITSDSSGNIKWFYSSTSDNRGTPGSSIGITNSLAPNPVSGKSMWTLPAGSNVPLIQINIPANPTTNFYFVIQANNNPTLTDYARFFWEIEYGWGINT